MELIGASTEIVKLRRLIEYAAQTPFPVLLVGETGTGKEVVAQIIHEKSPVACFPRVVVDCASLSSTLAESELFGHVRGAFTGAMQGRVGLLAHAGRGTVFLDEIGELPLELQAKLLRTLQEQEIRLVGSNTAIHFDARIVAATNRNLQEEVAAKRFREDLYYRLDVLTIELPPLRCRREDIPLLANHFVESLQRYGRPGIRLSAYVLDALADYDWPGNVRQLKHVIERLTAMHPGEEIRSGDLPSVILSANPRRRNFVPHPKTEAATLAEPMSLEEAESRTIRQALSVANGMRSKAATILGVGRTTLYRKMKKLRLQTSPWAETV